MWAGDVINNVMNRYLYNCSRFFVIMKNAVVSFIKEYRGPTLMPPYDVIDNVIIRKNTFLGIIWDGLFIFCWVQIEGMIYVSKFAKGPPFSARDKLFYRKLERKLNILLLLLLLLLFISLLLLSLILPSLSASPSSSSSLSLSLSLSLLSLLLLLLLLSS